MRRRRRRCRIWWPKELAWSEPPPSYGSLVLFGWFMSSSPASIDVVVAFSGDSHLLLQETVSEVNRRMPISLQEKSGFALLGHCSTNLDAHAMEVDNVAKEDHAAWGLSPGCCALVASSHVHHSAETRRNWICLACHLCDEQNGTGFRWLPTLHHILWNGTIHTPYHVHVILYETPLYGVQHYSLNFFSTSEDASAMPKRPKWVEELHLNESLFDLETVVLAINSSAAASVILERHVGSVRCFLAFWWQLLAISVASISTIFYIMLQLLHSFISCVGLTWLGKSLTWVFQATTTNMHIRSSQILYWPFFLQDNCLRSKSCVEYAEKDALRRHSMWSSLAVDLLLGNLIGLALLFHAESTWLWIRKFSNSVTNELLRSGCVWLMGVPAGFKLNMELARVLGMICLNAIQIWSTLWIFVGYFCVYFIKGLAIWGILFGATIPTALTIDTITLATRHVSALHWGFSLLYSQQTQAIASLWRIFRGRKWNPLRQRLDSYDYTVKQHVVGSLLFSPLLLLLPTSSVFYIFFTILDTSVILISALLEIAISMVHGTPFFKIFLWLVRRRRFPAGIWFEIVSSHTECQGFGCFDEECSSSKNPMAKKCRSLKRSSFLVSILHSNFLNPGEIVSLHYKKIFSRVSAFVTASAYGALTGKGAARTLGSPLPATLPWIFIPVTEYWRLCYSSILACMPGIP